MISASIVLYNTKDNDIETVLSSYKPSSDRRLYIIDNSPAETFYCKNMNSEFISYIHNGKNLGYGSAHNIGIRKAIEIGTDYHIVLNPDISFKPEILDELIEYADSHNDVVYILPKVIYPNGELQYLCKLLPTPFDLIGRRFLPNVGFIKSRNEKYILKNSGYNRIINPPCLSGCFMFMRTETLKENRILFDENFFMYCEDYDLMRRLHKIGSTIFYPYVTIVHNHQRESYKNYRMLKQHILSAIKFFNKYGWLIDTERKQENKKILDEIKCGE